MGALTDTDTVRALDACEAQPQTHVDNADAERALDALEAKGARQFDAPSCDCVRALLTRSEELDGETARILSERALVHLARLRTRFEQARAQTQARLAAAERVHGELPRLRDLLTIGDLTRVRRALRKLELRPPTRAPLAPRRSAAAYEDALAELVAALALARAVDVVPEQAGPYNPLRIASELLTRMRAVSPLYLTVQLNRLEELASMLSLPELPPPPAAPRPSPAKKKRRALKS